MYWGGHTIHNSVYFYTEESIGENYSRKYKKFISASIYKEAVITPLIKSLMFLFSGFGMFDLDYEKPVNALVKSLEKPYLSIFDGLKHIRMTKFGSFVMDLKKSYNIPVKN